MRKVLVLCVISLLLTACTIAGTVKNFVGFQSIVQVAPGIWLGNRTDATNLKELKAHGIDAVLNVAAEVDDPVLPGILQKKIGIREINDADTHAKLIEAETTLETWVAAGHQVLVHCWLGENRSPWVIAHEQAWKNGDTWQQEFAKIKKVRPEAYIKGWMF